MIILKNISLYLGNEKPALKLDDLSLENGLWAIIGRNGAGKSTFLNAISGVNTHFSGQITINDKLLQDWSAVELAKNIAVVFSKTELFGNHTALDVLYLGRLPYQGVLTQITEQDKTKVQEVIELLCLELLLPKPFSVLSDGEKQLIMIGRALVQYTPILILDEPTAFLDVVNRKKIISLLADISKNQQKLILFSSHNMDLVQQFCDGILMVKGQNILKVTSKAQFNDCFEKLFADEV